MAAAAADGGHSANAKRWFVGIGVGAYDDPSLNLPKACSDVGRMGDWFVTGSNIAHQHALSELSQSPTWSQISRNLSVFLRTCSQDDIIVVYVACHGEFGSGAAYLFGRDTPATDIAGQAFLASELGRMLGSSKPHNVLLIVDACVAGTIAAAIADATRTAVRDRNSIDPRRTFAQVIIASTYGLDPAIDGEFASAFLRTVNDERWTGTVRPWIGLEQLIQGLNAELTAAATGQSVECSPWFNGEVTLLPNPNVGARAASGLFNDEEFAAHFDPAARGVSRSESGAFFTGRTDELRQVTRWLDRTGIPAQSSPLFVITGSPGSGKSALLSRIAQLSQPSLLPAGTDMAALPKGTVPQPDALSGVVWCHGKNRDQMMVEIGKILGGSAPTMETLLKLGQAKGDGKTLAIDALDEAAAGEAEAIAGGILAPLAIHTPMRIVVATRAHAIGRGGNLLDALPVSTDGLLDLDASRNRTRDMTNYVRARLADRNSAEHPSRAELDTMIDHMAEAIAGAAGRSFLVASLAARSTPIAPPPPNGYKLPVEVGEALAAYLNGLDDPDGARDVLRPLAWSLGAGQPWGAIWEALGSTLARGSRRITDNQIRTVLNSVGDLVVETDDAGEPVYRLFHEALAEHLRDTTHDLPTAPGRIALAMLSFAAGKPWATVARYCRNNLPTWLMRANMTDELADVMLDPAWARERDRERGRAKDPTFDIEAAALQFLTSERPLHLAPFCHQYSRSTRETLPTLIEVLALSGQQRRAMALADNLTDVADRMLAFRGLAQIYAADGELKSAGQCAQEVERTLPAMHADHQPMAWCWAAQGHIAARDELRAGMCARKATESVSNSDEWDRSNGLFWAAMAARAVSSEDLRLDIVRRIEASGQLSFRNQYLQAASVARCHDLLRRSLADRLAQPADTLEPVRHGNLALALIDAGLADEMDLLAAHVGALRPPGESDSLKRWVWALARSGRFAQSIEAIAWIGEPVEYSKAIARIAPILVDHGDARHVSRLRAVLSQAMPSEDPDTQARLIRALWVVGDQELALAAAEKAIARGASDSVMVDQRAEALREQRRTHVRGKVARRAMITSRAPVLDEVKARTVEDKARSGDLAAARQHAEEIQVPEFKARALTAIAHREPDIKDATRNWLLALTYARRAGRSAVERTVRAGTDLLQRAGQDAGTLTRRIADVDAAWELALFVEEYATIRKNTPSGPDRTRLFLGLMLAPVQLATARPWSEAELRTAWERGEDGSRLFVLALMRGDAGLIIPEFVADAIRASRSAFEQYNALNAIYKAPVDRNVDQQIAKAIRDEMDELPRADGTPAWLNRGNDRRRLAKAILNRVRG